MDIIEIFERFPTQDSCVDYLEQVRWRGTPACPYCQSSKCTPLPKQRRHHCNTCNTTFSVTVRTIFHHTHLPLQKWFLAVSLILDAKKGISARQLGRHLKVHRNTAWRISMKIREAMTETHQRELLRGIVEMDETYIGGNPPRRPRGRQDKGSPRPRGRATTKQPVVGMVERNGNVKAAVVPKAKGLGFKRLSLLVREHVDTDNAVLITDEWRGYTSMHKLLPHFTINHQLSYVDGEIHTNTIESFWALLKRGIIGQFHKVSVRHLHRYINEFCYRFNNRKNGCIFEQTLARGLGVL